MKQLFGHLTNFSLNKHSDDFVQGSADILEPNNGSKRTLTALYKQIIIEYGKYGKKVARKLQENIKDVCAGTLAVFLNMMQHTLRPQ